MTNCGVDIVKISRIEESIKTMGEAFLKRVYTDEEIKYCESKRMCKYQSYAARFAAKEAAYKALSDVPELETWKDIEVCKKENGKPYIKLNNKLENIINENNIDISLSHDTEYAIASVVIERGNN